MNEVKNKVSFLGSYDTVQDILKYIKTENGPMDFNKIESMEEEDNDLILNDYMNLCLNIYIKNCEEKKDELIKIFELVGCTRKVPYKFHILTDSQINSAKSKYKKDKIEKDIDNIMKKIQDKSIFNGAFKRNEIWGSIGVPYDVYAKDNRIEFLSNYKAPLLIFKKLSTNYKDIRIEYEYEKDGEKRMLLIADGVIKEVKDGRRTEIDEKNDDYNEPSLFNLIQECSLI